MAGLPFLLAGLFCMVAPFLPVLSNLNRLSWQAVGWSLFGLVFVVSGAILALGRTGTVLDRETWTVRRWWGLPFTIWSRSAPLDHFIHVRLERSLGDEDDSFPVRLMGDGATVQVFDSSCYHQSRVQAERVATFLGWDLHDRSRGEAVVREPAELQETLRERLQRSGAAPSMRSRPEEAKAVCRVEGGSLSLEIPPMGMDGAHRSVILTGQVVLFMVFLGLAYLVPKASVARSGSVGDYFMVMGITLSFSLMGLWMAFALIRAGRKWAARATSVYIDDRYLRVIHHSVYEEESIEFGLDELEELVIGLAQEGMSWKRQEALIARSDRTTLEFGLGLSREELEWLRDAFHFALWTQPRR